MTQRNIDVMDIIVGKLAEGEKFSQALKAVYAKRNVILPYHNEMDNVAITSLKLSTRTTNALMRSRLKTIGDVVCYCNDHKITNASGVGEASGIELFEAILDYCWAHMTQDEQTQFLIDTVERNSNNIIEYLV